MYETLISAADAFKCITESAEQTVVVDCRYALADAKWGRAQYTAGHLPCAVYADLNLNLSGQIVPGVTGRHPLPEPDKFVDWVREAGIDGNTQVIAYDQGGGGIAARLWWLMRWMGHDAVAVLDGGWPAWTRAGLPVEEEVGTRPKTIYEPSLRNEMAVDIKQVAELCKSRTHLLVDAREENRYAGIEEPIDPVAGHIPGAVNVPFVGNVDAHGQWKSSDELRGRFQHLMEGRSCENVVFYCGSGVTACHNILAMKYAGFGDARLFPGSWSEWITDAARDIELLC